MKCQLAGQMMMANKNNKIAFFSPSLRGGGSEKVLLNLCNCFSDRGFSVDIVLAQKEGPYLTDLNKNINIVDLKSKRVLFSLFPLLNYLRKEEPQILFSSMEHTNTIAILAKFISGAKTKVFIRAANTMSVSMQGIKAHKRVQVLYLAMIFYRFADKIIANSEGSADDLAKTLKIAKKKIEVIYNPIINSAILQKSKENITHVWLKDKKHAVILGVGRLVKQKDFATLINAVAKINEHRNVKLIILGEGNERRNLKKLIERLGVEDNIDMPGFVDNPYAYMARVDAFVLSSRWEGLPNTLIEAMACGTPVVSTDCPSGPSEILENGKYGKLVGVGNVTELAKAMEETLDKPIESEKLRYKASFFFSENIINKYFEIMEL